MATSKSWLSAGPLTASEEERLRLLSKRLQAPLPHPEAAQLAECSHQVSTLVQRHFLSLRQQTVGRRPSRAEMEALLRQPVPESGQDWRTVLRRFQTDILPNALRVNHPRFWAFIPGAPTYWSILGEWLAAGTNFFLGVWAEAAAPAQVELVVLDWFKQIVGYPLTAGGLLTGGGSEANLIALLAARQGLSWEERSKAVLYVSDQCHHSVDRAAQVMGLHPQQLRRLPSIAGRLEPARLAQAVAEDRQAGRRPWAVVASAGTTNTGAIDPLAALAAFCRQEHLWLHVDAAYGWAARLLPEGPHWLAGLEEADSLTLDPHKWFAQTFDAGCVLVRDPQRLRETFALHSEYLDDVAPAAEEINFCDYGLALTRRFRALKIWLSLQVLGLAWFRALVRHCCALAELTALLLRQSGCFEVLEPQLSIVCFRYVPAGGAPGEVLDRLNQQLLEDARRTGQVFLSSTRWQGRRVLRCCFVNWQTTAADVQAVVALLTELGRQLRQAA
jgi:aromatic-L-amino-acid decarboxylase